MSRAVPEVSVVVPTRNRPRKLTRLVESLSKCTYPRFTVTIVDDCSDYDVGTHVGRTFPYVRVLRNEARMLLAFSRNRGARESCGEYVFFIDDDNVVAEDILTELVKFLEAHPSFAVCSPVVYLLDRPDKTWTTYTVRGSFPGFYRLGHDVPNVPIQTWSFHDAFMVRRSVFESLGRFDQDGFPIHFSELDFTYTLHENGYSAAVVPSARAWLDHGSVHMHVDKVRAFYTLRNRIILLKKHEPRYRLVLYCCSLPIFAIYYLVSHTRSAPDKPLETAYGLFRGILAGLVYRDSGGRPHPPRPNVG
jgi:GT2 family glycosyltransferase